MKQFIFAKTLVAAMSNVTTEGQLIVANNTGADFLQFVAGRGANIVPDTFVAYKKNLRWTKTAYAAGTTFEGTVTCGFTSGKVNETYVVISKCGAVFNERNVWTASGQGTSAAAIATSLAKNINASTATHGLTATANAAVVTLKAAANDFTDYIVKAKNVVIDSAANTIVESDATTAVTTKGKPGVGDAAFIKNLAHKCVGDKGIGYTDVEGFALNPANFYIGNIADDVKCNIYNVTFYNPRYDHRIDEALYQTIHIAVPTSVAATVLENALNDVDSSNEQTEDDEPSA